MIRHSVQSSDIAAIGYDEKALILEIEFISGGIYQYFAVPVNLYSSLIQASSPGKYFHQNIRLEYKYAKINL